MDDRQRQAIARALMDVPTLSGRERRQVQGPPPVDPVDASAAMALGAVDVMGIPSGLAGLYSPQVRDMIRGPQERNPGAAMVGALPSMMLFPWAKWGPQANPNAWRAGLFGLGVTHKPSSTSEID